MTSSNSSLPASVDTQGAAPGAQDCIVVLGMHRSGTSALAGVLNILGADVPKKLMDPNPDNPKGYFESSAIYDLHRDLLKSAGARWDDWLPITPKWFTSSTAETFRAQASQTLTHEYGASRLFVLKDPRICRLVPFWQATLEDLGVTPRFLLTLRHPLEVASSLQRRDKFDQSLGLLIWLRHALQAEADTRGQRRCFTSYSELLGNWGHVAEKVQDQLGVTLPRMSLNVVPEVDDFLSTPLRKFREDPATLLKNPLVAAWIRETYAILDRWAQDGEDEGDHARIDAILADFNATGPIFFGIVQASRTNKALLQKAETWQAKLTEERDALKGEQAALAETITTLEQNVATARQSAEARQAELEKRAQDLARLKAERDQTGQDRDAAQAELEQRQHELEQLRSELTQRRHELEDTHDSLQRKTRDLDRLRQEQQTPLQERERSEMAARIATLESEARAHLSDLTQKAADWGTREAELNRNLGQKDAKIASLENSLDALSKDVAKMTGFLTETEDALEESRKKAREQEQLLDSRSRELSQMTRLLMEGEQALKQTRTESEAALKEAADRAERAEFAMMALQSSTSWRLMSPLRALSSALRRRK